MEYRILGKTGLQVSALSFGGSSLGSVFREVDQVFGVIHHVRVENYVTGLVQRLAERTE